MHWWDGDGFLRVAEELERMLGLHSHSQGDGRQHRAPWQHRAQFGVHRIASTRWGGHVGWKAAWHPMPGLLLDPVNH